MDDLTSVPYLGGLAFRLPKADLASFEQGVAQRDVVELRLDEATEHYLDHIHLEQRTHSRVKEQFR